MEITVEDFLREHQKKLLQLDRAGIKTINSAVDYLSIVSEFHNHDWIPGVEERKKVVATRCKVSVRTVEQAVSLLKKKL